jgi:hypothetical protein
MSAALANVPVQDFVTPSGYSSSTYSTTTTQP